MSRVTNVPKKDSKYEITCELLSDGFLFIGENGSTLCRVTAATQEGIARQLADLLATVRDVGFEHGREHVRDAMGIKR